MATITPQQLKKYRFVWGRVKKALVELGDFSPSDAEAERKNIHREVLGSEKSSMDFSNQDLNRVLDAFDKILVIFDGPSNQPTRNAANTIWAIQRLGLPEETVSHIARDTYGNPDWRKLTERQLACLRYTCTRHARSLAKR